jgi:hypothetical protein
MKYFNLFATEAYNLFPSNLDVSSYVFIITNYFKLHLCKSSCFIGSSFFSSIKLLIFIYATKCKSQTDEVNKD